MQRRHLAGASIGEKIFRPLYIGVMISILSPAKTIDEDIRLQSSKITQPQFLREAAVLAKGLRALETSDLRKLMGVSEKIAELNHDRYQSFRTPFSAKSAGPCILAFQGDVYQGLGAEDFKARDLAYAQKHLRILSGLYGMLRPLDLMHPYRLEMGTKYKNPSGATLYDYCLLYLISRLET